MTFEVGDLVLCTVDRIAGTVVVVKIQEDGREIEGNIVMSEIAPGRIRNIRDYVVPKKKIVCKILRISQTGNIDLSLRRVSQKERKEILEQEQQEKSYASILKGILGEEAGEIIKKISEKEKLGLFLEEAKNKPEALEKIAGKENTKKIVDILNAQKSKKKKIKKEMYITTIKPNGITLIKKVLENFKGLEVKYIAAGKYSLETESEDVKVSDKKMREKLDVAEKEAKKLCVEFVVK
jgi:translation initiation factor 2 alpha subunit (eIF-2alpha)